MNIELIKQDLTVCKVNSEKEINLTNTFYFIGKTDEECSLVCPTEDVPADTIAREDGWNAFRIQGVLDFSLIGILAKISTILAQYGIGVFVVSTFNTDYVLVKKENFDRAINALYNAGYSIC